MCENVVVHPRIKWKSGAFIREKEWIAPDITIISLFHLPMSSLHILHTDVTIVSVILQRSFSISFDCTH